MAEGISGYAAPELDSADTTSETELLQSVNAERSVEVTGESFDCTPKNLNVLLGTEDKNNRKSLFTEIMEASSGSGESCTGNASVTSDFAHGINPIVGKVVVGAPVQADAPASPEQSNLAETGEDPTTSAGVMTLQDSMTATRLAAQAARDAAEEAMAAAATGREIVAILHRARQDVESRKSAATERAVAISAGVREDEARDAEARYHFTMADKCDAALNVLLKRIGEMEVKIRACEDAAGIAQQRAAQADRVAVGPATAHFYRVDTIYRKKEIEDAIVLLYQKEYTALGNIKRLWENDTSPDQASDSSGRNEYTQECHNAGRKTRIAHAVGFLVGVSTLGMSALLTASRDSFVAVLLIGLVITVWTTGYWTCAFARKCFCRRVEAGTTVPEETTEEMPDYMERVRSQLNFVDSYLSQRNKIPRSDVEESDSGSSETLRAGDVATNA